MKHSILSLALVTTALLGACDHYSERLAAMDGSFPHPSQTPAASAAAASPLAAQQVAQARTDAALNAIATAAGGEFNGQPYNIALAQAYYDRAVLEKNAMDHSAAHYFTGKAEAALRGETPEPAVPADFGIERSDAAEMNEARAKLVSAIHLYKGTDKQPTLVKAQVDFDSWLDQAAENKTGPALTGREGYIEAMAQLEAPMAETRRYGILFTPGQFALSEGAQTIIDDAGNFIRENPGQTYTVTLIEKAPGPYSAQRVQAIQTALAAKGVPAGSITTAAATTNPAPAHAAQGALPQDTIEIVVSFTGGPSGAPLMAPTAVIAPQAIAPAAAPTSVPVPVAPAPTPVVTTSDQPVKIAPAAPVRTSPYRQ